MNLPTLIAGLGSQELFFIVLVVLLLFGATAIPRLARSLGRAQGEFQKAKSEFSKEMEAGKADARGADEASIRQAARDLGIEEEGLPLEDVKKLLNERVG